MKKIFTLMVLVCLAMAANAQDRKLWDFSKGFETSRANLDADETHWAKDATDESGATTRWKDATKMSGVMMANGEPISELEGLTFGTAGLSSSNNYLLQATVMRVTRNKMEIILPKLAPGQKVSMMARSANGTATDRGFKGNANMTYNVDESTSPDGLCPGNKVEGSLGTYTLVWDVTGTPAEGEDSVECKIIAVTGGCDISYIMIDDGKVGPSKSMPDVGYIVNSNNGYDAGNDLVPVMLEGAVNFITIDQATTDVARDSLYQFDALVLGTTATADNLLGDGREIIGFVPTVTLSNSLIESWELGTQTDVSGTAIIPEDVRESPAYTDIDVTEGTVTFTADVLKGITFAEKYALLQDTVYATADELPVITRWAPNRNDFVFFGATDASFNNDGEGYLFLTLGNIIRDIYNNKKATEQTAAPKVSQTYNDGSTVVKLSCATKNSKIYFTTDGTDPSEENGTLYTEALTYNETATIKAKAYAIGYFDSKVTSADILIKYLAQTPEFSYVREAGKTTVTITGAEGTNLYYNFVGKNDKKYSSYYDGPIELTQPATITAFATSDVLLQSQTATESFGVDGITADNIRLDVLASFSGSTEKWWWDTSEIASGSSSKVAYYNGKSATSIYINPEDSSEIAPYTFFYASNAETPDEAEPWAVATRGQCVQWESTKPVTEVYDGATAGYYADAAFDLQGTPTAGFICFGAKVDGEPFSADLRSTKKFQAPFSVEAFIGNNGGNDKYYLMTMEVSTDGENWTVVDSVSYSAVQRLWKRNYLSYEGNDEVYLRFAHKAGGTKIAIYNLNVMYNGPLSKEYVDPQSQPTILRGDANCDGIIDVADITAIASYILGSTPETFSANNADANNDSNIDVADITATAAIILGN